MQPIVHVSFLHLPPLSLRQRIFLAMVTGALMVYIVAGWALLNRISDAFSQRITMQSQSTSKLTEQLFHQQEDQLARTAHFIAEMSLIQASVADGDITMLTLEHAHIRSATQLTNNEYLFIANTAGKPLYTDLTPQPKQRSSILQPVTEGLTKLGTDLTNINGIPSLIGVAPITSGEKIIGAVAIIEPFTRTLMNTIQQQVGAPCSLFDPSGRLISTSSGIQGWPTAVPTPTAHGPQTPAKNPLSVSAISLQTSQGANVYLIPLFSNYWNLVGTIAIYPPIKAIQDNQFLVQGAFLALLFAAFLVSATVAWLFSRMIAQPIQQLATAADDIASGQYDHPITIQGSDEIGQLTTAFERMRRRVRETTAALTEEKHRSEAEATVVNAVLNSARDGILMIDSQQRVRVVNERWTAMFGLNANELQGIPADTLHQYLSQLMEDPQTFLEHSYSLAKSSTMPILEEEFTQRIPEFRRLRRFSAPVHSTEGMIIGRVFIYADVTREYQADELKQALLSTVSHELRTPLATIKGYARTLLIQDWDAPTRREFLVFIDEEADKLNELVENLLDLSKLEAGVLQIQRGPVRLDSLLTRSVTKKQAQDPTHSYRCLLPEALPVVWADPRRIEQVLTNLLENARKYAHGGEILVSAQSDGAFVQVRVQDDGPGIPPDLAERVFDRFYRADNRLTRETGGTGLGLSICRGLVEAHGGKIWIEQPSQHGTTVVFTLPIAPAEYSITETSTSSPMTAPTG